MHLLYMYDFIGYINELYAILKTDTINDKEENNTPQNKRDSRF